MANQVLVVNIGSSSIKFGVFLLRDSVISPVVLYRGSAEVRAEEIVLKVESDQPDPVSAGMSDCSGTTLFPGATDLVSTLFDWLDSTGIIARTDAVCHRVVHGGDFNSSAVMVTDGVLERLEKLRPFAPLHQPKCLEALYNFKRLIPEATHLACFDTAFHRTMPELAQRFAIPRELNLLGIKSYGFHGLSYQFIATELRTYFEKHNHRRVIVAHLGSGASICAMRDGTSVATTMSFTPLDGLPMATRCGSIDAGAVLYMASQLDMSLDDISTVLNKKSGLLGLSGISGDTRELLESDSGDATFALEYFNYRICQELGAMTAVLQGVDALVFTGGIGFHSWQIRSAICKKMSWLGIDLDNKTNRENAFRISTANSKVEVLVQKTDEELVMAQNALHLLGNRENWN